MPHTYQCPLRWADMDLLGHVNNVTYLDYVTEARQALFAGHPVASASVRGHQVDFVTPLHHRQEPYAVHTWVAHVGSRSFTLCSEVRDGDTVLASAAVVMVTFDLETQRTTEMAEEQRARLLQALDAPA